MMKFDKFTIFLLLLGLLVIITLVMNFKRKSPLESFVNFQNQPAAGTAIYIPQYSTDTTHTVTSLYDSLYFDSKNGTLIEVFAPACSSGCDTTGANITYICAASRDSRGITAMPSLIDDNGNIQPYNSPQSQITSVQPLYNQYVYTTSCVNTNFYQVIYISWNTDTYLHIIDLSASSAAGTNIKTIHMNSGGFIDAQSTFTPTTLQPYTSLVSSFVPTASGSLSTTSVTGYGASLLQLGQDNINNSIYYDVVNGNIVLNNGGTFKVYNRGGASIQNLAQPSTPWVPLKPANTFTINDTPGLSVIVTASNNDTIINMLIPNGNKYKLIHTYRFNKLGIVLTATNDVDHTTPVNTGSGNTSSGNTSSGNTSSGKTGGDISGNSNVCGDDISCKWYWYFNTIAQKNGKGDTYFSDDYFLKTEAVPPVCPECPQCPSSNGVCTNCGGSGGSGTTPTPQSTPSAGLPAGAIQDNSGNIYIPYTDPSGNVRYILYSNGSQKKATSIYNIPPGAKAPPGAVAIKQDSAGNFTFVDKNGNFVSNADPNTFGGVVSLTALGAGSIANNLVSTTADLAKDVGTGAVGFVENSASGIGGYAKDAATGAIGLTKDTVGGAVGLAKDTVGGAVGLAKDTVGGAVGLLKDVGSGIAGLGRGLDVRGNNDRGTSDRGTSDRGYNDRGKGAITVNNEDVSTGSSLGYTPFGSDKTMGSVPGETSIDNYSYYGAVQSKGGNYMPVTADFSAFRK